MITLMMKKLKHFIKIILRGKHARKLTQKESELEYLKWRYFFEIITRKYVIIVIVIGIIWLKETQPFHIKYWLHMLT